MELEAEQQAQWVVENALKSSAACLLHPARTMLQAFPGHPLSPSHLLSSRDPPARVSLASKHRVPVLNWREGKTGCLELPFSPLALHMDNG